MYIEKHKNYILPHVALFGMLVLTSTTIYLSSILKIPAKSGAQIIEEAKVIPSKFAMGINEFEIKNKLGSLHFKLSNNKEWILIGKEFEVIDQGKVNQFLIAIGNIKLKTVMLKTKSNLSSYMLEGENGELNTASLNLIGSENKNLNLQFGLTNSIDNSTYITISNRENILHTDAININIENLFISDFQNLDIFNGTINEISFTRKNGKMESKKWSGSVSLKASAIVYEKDFDKERDMEITINKQIKLIVSKPITKDNNTYVLIGTADSKFQYFVTIESFKSFTNLFLKE